MMVQPAGRAKDRCTMVTTYEKVTLRLRHTDWVFKLRTRIAKRKILNYPDDAVEVRAITISCSMVKYGRITCYTLHKIPKCIMEMLDVWCFEMFIRAKNSP